jgi:hypothetical protein
MLRLSGLEMDLLQKLLIFQMQVGETKIFRVGACDLPVGQGGGDGLHPPPAPGPAGQGQLKVRHKSAGAAMLVPARCQ